jgi:hypothetical protein
MPWQPDFARLVEEATVVSNIRRCDAKAADLVVVVKPSYD